MWSEYRCYLSVLAGFSSRTSGGPGGRDSVPQLPPRVKLNLMPSGVMSYICAYIAAHVLLRRATKPASASSERVTVAGSGMARTGFQVSLSDRLMPMASSMKISP